MTAGASALDRDRLSGIKPADLELVGSRRCVNVSYPSNPNTNRTVRSRPVQGIQNEDAVGPHLGE